MAARQQLSESALLQRLIDLTLQTAGAGAQGPIDEDGKSPRGARVTIRLRGEDQALLQRSTAAGADPKDVSQLIGQIKEIREQLQSRELKDETPTTPPTSTPTPPQPSTLDVVEQVLTEPLGAVRAGELMALIKGRLPVGS